MLHVEVFEGKTVKDEIVLESSVPFRRPGIFLRKH
jgi:hypothetical protein